MSNATILICWTIFGLINLSLFLYYWERLSKDLQKAVPLVFLLGPLATIVLLLALLIYWWDE